MSVCFSCLCKRNLIIKQKTFWKVSFYFFSHFPFSLCGMGFLFCSLWFVSLWHCTSPMDKIDLSCLASPLQCCIPVLCWWKMFSLLSAVLLHLSVTRFFSLV